MKAQKLPFYYLRVTTPEEQRMFILAVQRGIGYTLEAEFFRYAVAYLFFIGPHVRATFAINLNAQQGRSHYFCTLDDDLVEELQFQEDFSLADCTEICANWKDDRLSSRQSQAYYSLMTEVAYRETKRSKRKLVVGGSVTKPLKKLQHWLLPRVLYCGPFSVGKAPAIHTNGRLPIAKIYCIEVDKLPMRARMIMLSRYQIRFARNNFRKLKLAFQKKWPTLNLRAIFRSFDRIL